MASGRGLVDRPIGRESKLAAWNWPWGVVRIIAGVPSRVVRVFCPACCGEGFFFGHGRRTEPPLFQIPVMTMGSGT